MNEMIKRRKRLTEPEAAFLMRQLLQAIHYLHDQLVIHRDLKLGNLFLDRYMNVKVGDLGLATRLDSQEEKRKTICGTPNYIAPEVIQGDRATRGHSFEVDVWSMGVILYTVLVGKPPYEAKDVKATYQRILNNEYSFPQSANMSDSSKDLITSMLQSKPGDRPNLSTIANHPFFTHSFIPNTLPPNSTHVAPKWDKNEMSDAPRKSCLPLLSQRKPFSFRDVNVEPAADRSSKPTKTQMTSLDVQGVVKNVVSAVMGVGIKASEKQGFKVFDETETKKSEDIVSRTAAMSIKTNTPLASSSPRSEILPSPTSEDAFVLYNMIDRIDAVLEITTKRSYVNVNADSISLKAFSTGGPEKWVARYVDYTSKYGLGFLLSDAR
jgi:polo-like kinase 1